MIAYEFRADIVDNKINIPMEYIRKNNKDVKVILMFNEMANTAGCDETFADDTELFYSESNMNFLLEGIAELNAGKGIQRDLIEFDEDRYV